MWEERVFLYVRIFEKWWKVIGARIVILRETCFPNLQPRFCAKAKVYCVLLHFLGSIRAKFPSQVKGKIARFHTGKIHWSCARASDKFIRSFLTLPIEREEIKKLLQFPFRSPAVDVENDPGILQMRETVHFYGFITRSNGLSGRTHGGLGA